MNYQKHYDSLVQRASKRTLEGYVEKHHTMPKCMGGADEISNIVELTAEEHFVAHQLLVKIYPDNRKLVYALICMSGKGNSYHLRNNKAYAWIRQKCSMAQKGRIPWNKGKTHMAKEAHPLWGKPRSKETKKKISLKAIGRKEDPANLKKRAQAIREYWKNNGGRQHEQAVCFNCSFEAAKPNIVRHHNENCKRVGVAIK